MTSGPVSAKTVVIADDTGFVRDRFKTALEQAGHRAITVRSAVELLAKVRADLDHIDLVVVDLRLPNAPGVDLIRGLPRRLKLSGNKCGASDGRMCWTALYSLM